MVASRATVAIAAAVTGFVTLWFVAFGAEQMCTTDALCTLDSCPTRCSAPERVLVVSGMLLVGLALVYWFVSRFRQVMFVATSALVVVASIAVMLVRVRG